MQEVASSILVSSTRADRVPVAWVRDDRGSARVVGDRSRSRRHAPGQPAKAGATGVLGSARPGRFAFGGTPAWRSGPSGGLDCPDDPRRSYGPAATYTPPRRSDRAASMVRPWRAGEGPVADGPAAHNRTTIRPSDSPRAE